MLKKALRFLPAIAGLAMLAVLPAGAGTLEGRWILVHETYGTGDLNLRRDKPPQMLEFVREGGTLAGRTRLEPGAPERSWPALSLREADAVAAVVEELTISPTENRVRAHYVTPFLRADKVRLDIVEDYVVSEDGSSLTGTVTVTFLSGGETRGTFIMHRTFERQP